MDCIDKTIALATEQTLTMLSNKGTYKRALKESEGMILSAEKVSESYRVKIGNEICTITSPLDDCKCSCVSRGICRHIITAILLLKSLLPEYSSKDYTVTEPAQTVAEDTQQQDISKQCEPSPQPLSYLTQEKIRSCAENCIHLMCDIFSRGLVRAEKSDPENFELAAVSCHALRMANAERQMREISGRLSDCVSRRASFSAKQLAHIMFRYADDLNRLIKADMTDEMLGTFRREYKNYNGTLDILPIGARNVSGEYEGIVYYFLNTDQRSDQHFFTYSDIRPTYYEKNIQQIFLGSRSTPIWDLASPLKNYMQNEIKLKNAKVSGSHLSSSSKTTAEILNKANLNCTALKRLIIYDFSELAYKVSASDASNETDDLFFVSPVDCTASFFDKHTQQQILTIIDHQGRQISVTAKYTAENKDFISQLDAIGSKMLNDKSKQFVIFAKAHISGGRLELFPLEIYDFITLPPNVCKKRYH